MKRYILPSLCAALLLGSCYSDRGNYDYGDINEVTVGGLPEGTVTVYKDADFLKIQPTLASTVAGGDYEYTWTAVMPEGNIDGEFEFEIGTEKDLDYLVTLPLGKYFIYLKVLDRATGVTWRQKFDLEVIVSTTSGWMVLCDENGAARLDMISFAGDDELLVRDILRDMPVKQGPQRILMNVNMSSSAIFEDKIILITGSGSCYLNPEYLTWEEAFDLKYEMGVLPEPFVPIMVASISPYEYSYSKVVMLTTTEIYNKTPGNGYVYELPKNNVAGESATFRVAPAVMTSIEDLYYQWEPPALLYDTDNKRFVQLDLAWNGTSCRVPTLKTEVWPLVTGKDFVYAANTRQNYASSFILLRDGDGKVWLHGITDFSRGTFVQSPNYHYPIDAPGIGEAGLFAVHTYYYFLFYVFGNEIYQFDMVSKESRKLTPKDANGNPVSFSGEEITFIKFNPLLYGNKRDPNGYGRNEYRLIVGSDKGGENGGTVRMIDIGERLNDEAILYREYSGFARPVDIALRERN